MTNAPWWNLLDQIVAVPFLEGVSPFFIAGIVLAALLLVGWIVKRWRDRSRS
jgi:hypothetical protein